MKVSYNWLSKYIDLSGIDAYELANKLTNSGVAVDIVEKRNRGVDNVVIGYVLDSSKHPEAEKLSICSVDVGGEEPVQIVCGAANVAKGQKVPVALVGASLPDGVKIKKAKLRGEISEGMICSAKELGLNEKLLPKDKAEGILVLPEDSTIGEPIEALVGLDDYILELELTPNRSDCLSMIGVAYEVGAILNRDVKLPENPLSNKLSTDQKVKVEIDAKDACKHYAARVLTDVKISASPQWLQNYLIGAGIRPINNVVDITNYVLLEYGQPLHAFDFERLEQPNILVRMAKANERVITLDDQERELDEEMLLITDGVKPIAIAGVMGAANSEVTTSTTKILLESAYFAGTSIRRTSKKLGLRSEASLRFEKGVDPNRIHAALNRAAQLLQEIAGATIDGEIYEHLVEQPKEEKILLNPTRVNKLLGTDINHNDMISIFKRLNFNVKSQEDGILVEVPTRRQDITIEEDLVEEVARLYGYDNIPTDLPSGVYIQGGLNERQKIRRKIKNIFASAGLKEVITYSFTGEGQQNILQGLVDDKKPIPLAMPLSEERKLLRTAILPNLLEVAQYNVNRRNQEVQFYEIGATFISRENTLTSLPEEKLVAAGLLSGQLPSNWQSSKMKLDFYYLKGIIEGLFSELGIEANYEAVAIKGYHPGRTAKITINNKLIGYIGQLHPTVQEQYDLKETYVFELDLDEIIESANLDISFKQLPKYPAIQRDLAIIVAKDIVTDNIMTTIRNSAGELLESLSLFDVYESEQIGNDKRSLAFSLTYRSLERTLVDEEVASLHNKVVVELTEKYHAELRK